VIVSRARRNTNHEHESRKLRTVLEERGSVKRAAVAWVFFVCFAIVAFYEAAKLPFGKTNAPGAGFFPTVLAALLALVSVIGLVAALRDGHEKSHEARLVLKKILLTVAALLAFAFMFEHVGYLVTTFLFVAFVLRAVEGKSWVQAGVVGLSASLVSYVIFGLLLGAPLPAGFLRV
jgi:putative tricarboxylic transport membrane protein